MKTIEKPAAISNLALARQMCPQSFSRLRGGKQLGPDLKYQSFFKADLLYRTGGELNLMNSPSCSILIVDTIWR